MICYKLITAQNFSAEQPAAVSRAILGSSLIEPEYRERIVRKLLDSCVPGRKRDLLREMIFGRETAIVTE